MRRLAAPARTRGYLDTMLVEAGCDSSAAECTTPRTAFAAASHVLKTALPSGSGVDVRRPHRAQAS